MHVETIILIRSWDR